MSTAHWVQGGLGVHALECNLQAAAVWQLPASCHVSERLGQADIFNTKWRAVCQPCRPACHTCMPGAVCIRPASITADPTHTLSAQHEHYMLVLLIEPQSAAEVGCIAGC